MSVDINIPHIEDTTQPDKMCYHCKHWSKNVKPDNLGLLYGACSKLNTNNGLMRMIKPIDKAIETYITFGCNQFESKE